ncbi:MAG: hypothetical protein RLZZ628_3439 [Bacteroidota bacterium]|jgi:hypothetical protein
MEKIDFDSYKSIWLASKGITDDLSTTEKGRLFAKQLFISYLDCDISEEDDDLFVSTGGSDGGIDLTYIQRSTTTIEGAADGEEGDTWYIVQSKYAGFQGSNMLFSEAHKIFATLKGATAQLSTDVKHIVEKLHSFLKNIGENDKLILLFMTVDPIQKDNRTLKEIEDYGKQILPVSFEVKAISLEDIYTDANKKDESSFIKVPLKGKLSNLADDMVLAGAVRLTDLYDFLKQYKTRSGGRLENLYDKNIRKFLGFKRQVNLNMKETLLNEPHQFGLYNNGITIIVKDWRNLSDKDGYSLTEPAVVNGCQSVNTIWHVLDAKASSGGTGTTKNEWRNKYEKAIAMVKIVKTTDEKLVENITRYTNKQNAISDSDFLSLESYFVQLKAEMAEKYQLFLEIQRGSWEVQLTRQKNNPTLKPFFARDAHAYAFELIKVYGAAWCGKVAEANVGYHSFNPGEPIYRDIVHSEEHSFGVDDLFVCFHLLKQIDRDEYAQFFKDYKRRKTETKFIFYRVVIELLRPLLQDLKLDVERREVITQSLKRLIIDSTTFKLLIDNAFSVMNEYLNPNEPDSYIHEVDMAKLNDFSKYIRDTRLLKDRDYSKNIFSCISSQRKAMSRARAGEISDTTKIKNVLNQTDFTSELPASLGNGKPSEYASTVEELKQLVRPGLRWIDIVKFLNSDQNFNLNSSAREYLRRWVKKHKPNWPPVHQR